jgi:hypothetical protein
VSTTDRYLSRHELAEFLTKRGFPIGKSTLDKLAMPSRGRNDGPPAGFWSNTALYDPEKALAWAKARFSNNWRAEMEQQAHECERSQRRRSPLSCSLHFIMLPLRPCFSISL